MKRISIIAEHRAYRPIYSYWTKVGNPGELYQVTMDWLNSNTTGRVVIGHTWFYFEYNTDAVFFKLSHRIPTLS
jgi:hypothetical protein